MNRSIDLDDVLKMSNEEIEKIIKKEQQKKLDIHTLQEIAKLAKDFKWCENCGSEDIINNCCNVCMKIPAGICSSYWFAEKLERLIISELSRQDEEEKQQSEQEMKKADKVFRL
jgi:hypothetical protein